MAAHREKVCLYQKDFTHDFPKIRKKKPTGLQGRGPVHVDSSYAIYFKLFRSKVARFQCLKDIIAQV